MVQGRTIYVDLSNILSRDRDGHCWLRSSSCLLRERNSSHYNRVAI